MAHLYYFVMKYAERVDLLLVWPINTVGGGMMDIAALSISLNEVQLMQQVSIAVTQQSMEMQQQQSTQIVEAMQTVNVQHPTLGNAIDISI